MKAKKASEGRHHRLREAAMREIAGIGVFMEGTLSKFLRAGRRTPGWQVTFKQKGKTRTVYVPIELVPEVQAWTKEYKRFKRLVRKVTAQSLAIVRRHGSVRRAAKRARPPTGRTTGPASPAS
jgi:hypothetical protein